MALLDILDYFFLNIIITLVLTELLKFILPVNLYEPFNQLLFKLRTVIQSIVEESFENVTFEVRILSILVMPFFVITYIAQMLFLQMLMMEEYIGLRVLFGILFMFSVINAAPTVEVWNELLDVDHRSSLSLTIKGVLAIQQLSNPVLPIEAFVFLVIFPFSALLKPNSSSTIAHKPALKVA